MSKELTEGMEHRAGISDCELRIADLKARKQESGEAQSKSIGHGA